MSLPDSTQPAPGAAASSQEKIARLAKAIKAIEDGQAGLDSTGQPLAAERDPAFLKEKAKAQERALRLLDSRQRSEQELRQRLAQAEFSLPVVDSVIAALRRTGVVDDQRFAQEWVRQRFAARGKAPAVLRRELRGKGVAAAAVEAAVAEISDSDLKETALELAQKKAATIRTAPASYQEKQKQLAKVAGMLARRGYPADLVREVAHQALNERLEELEAD